MLNHTHSPFVSAPVVRSNGRSIMNSYDNWVEAKARREQENGRTVALAEHKDGDKEE